MVDDKGRPSLVLCLFANICHHQLSKCDLSPVERNALFLVTQILYYIIELKKILCVSVSNQPPSKANSLCLFAQRQRA